MIVNPNVGGKQEAPVISVSADGVITATAGDEKTTANVTNFEENLTEYNMPVGYSCFGTIGLGKGCCCGTFSPKSATSATFAIHTWEDLPNDAYACVRAIFILDTNGKPLLWYFGDTSMGENVPYLEADGATALDNYFAVGKTAIDVVIGDTYSFVFNTNSTYKFVVIYDGRGSYSDLT